MDAGKIIGIIYLGGLFATFLAIVVAVRAKDIEQDRADPFLFAVSIICWPLYWIRLAIRADKRSKSKQTDESNVQWVQLGEYTVSANVSLGPRTQEQLMMVRKGLDLDSVRARSLQVATMIDDLVPSGGVITFLTEEGTQYRVIVK